MREVGERTTLTTLSLKFWFFGSSSKRMRRGVLLMLWIVPNQESRGEKNGRWNTDCCYFFCRFHAVNLALDYKLCLTQSQLSLLFLVLLSQLEQHDSSHLLLCITHTSRHISEEEEGEGEACNIQVLIIIKLDWRVKHLLSLSSLHLWIYIFHDAHQGEEVSHT